MRLGLVVYGSLDVLSGGNLYDATLVSYLEAVGHEVEIVSLPSRSYLLHLVQNVTSRGRFAQKRFDLLLEDELAHPSLFHLNRSLQGHGPIVSIVHHLRSSEDRPEWQNRLYRRVEKAYLQTVDAFVFNSHTTRETVEFLLQKKTKNVVATPGGDRLGSTMRREEVEARAREPGPLRLLFVGNLIPRKGLHVLLEALSALRAEPWELDIVGGAEMDPAYAARQRDHVQSRGLTDRVSFHGSLQGDALRARYENAQVLVVPSTYEGFGIVYLEAMSFGLPVIASAAGATDEIVRHETTGFLVQPGDALSLGLRLHSLMDDREGLARMSVTALEAFTDHPTWQQSMRAIEAFLCRSSEEARANEAP